MGAFGSLEFHTDNGYNPHESQTSTTDTLHNILNWFPVQVSGKCKVAGWCAVCGCGIVILDLALCAPHSVTLYKYLTRTPHYLSSILHARRKSSERLSNLPKVTEQGKGGVYSGPRPKWDWEWERFTGAWHPQIDKIQHRPKSLPAQHGALKQRLPISRGPAFGQGWVGPCATTAAHPLAEESTPRRAWPQLENWAGPSRLSANCTPGIRHLGCP